MRFRDIFHTFGALSKVLQSMAQDIEFKTKKQMKKIEIAKDN